MGYSLKTLTQELKELGLSDDGLVAYGQNAVGAVGALIAPMYAICKFGDKFVIVPFTNKRIEYEKKKEIDKKDILEAKISGFLLSAKLKITTTKGKVTYPIVQGKGAVKQILEKLGL